MSAGERQPLLTPSHLLAEPARIRAKAPPTLDQHRLLQTSSYMNANVPWVLVLHTCVAVLTNVLAVSGAYFFVLSSYTTFTPACWEYQGLRKTPQMVLCYLTSACFWTFPLVCAFLVVITFSKNLYDTRIYYECLLHRIMIVFDDSSVTQSPATWFVVLYGCVGSCMMVFTARDTEDVRTLAYGMLAYFMPVVSFAMVYLAHWQIESHIIPLSKFYDVDPSLAKTAVAESVFVPEAHFRYVFEDVEEQLAAGGSEVMQSHEYFGLLAAASRAAMTAATSAGDDAESSEPLAWYDACLARLDLQKTQDFCQRFAKVPRPEVLTFGWQLRRGGPWQLRLLHSPRFCDDRAVSFRRCAFAYGALTFLAAAALLWAYAATCASFLVYMRLVSPSLPIIRRLQLIPAKVSALGADAALSATRAARGSLRVH